MNSPLWGPEEPDTERKNEILRQILGLMAEGMTDTAIHRKTGLDVTWVSRQVRQMMLVTSSQNRLQLVSKSFRAGVLTGNVPAVTMDDSHWEILELLAQGYSFEQIAYQLHFSVWTILMRWRVIKAIFKAQSPMHAVALYEQMPKSRPLHTGASSNVSAAETRQA